MTAAFLNQIDWTRPWLSLMHPIAQPILAAPDWRQALNHAAQAAHLANKRGLPIRFVPQADLPAGVAYEAFINETGCVPTRENLHDFFNALVWLRFPQIKQQLNASQAAEIAGNAMLPDRPAKAGVTRGSLRDAATIFDENAALLVYSDAKWITSVRGHRWQEALQTSRQAFAHTVGVVLFGHALMEKLVDPYKAITAHGWSVLVEPTFFSLTVLKQCRWLDTVVSEQLKSGLATSQFTPLPILGVPGWWHGQDEAFYADTQVFRPPRKIL